jgi:hypothetical protein
MDFVDQFSFDIALEIMEFQIWKNRLEGFKILFERSASIDFWLSFSEEIEIGAIDYLYFQRIGQLGLRDKVKNRRENIGQNFVIHPDF